MLQQLLLLSVLAAPQTGDAPSDAPVRRPASAIQEPAARGECAERIYAKLRGARDPKAPFRKELPGEIAESGVQAIMPLLEVLQTRRIPAQGQLPAQTLSVYQREILLSALERIGARDVLNACEQSLGAAPGLDARVAALCVQGALGSAASLPRVFQLATEPQAQELRPELESALREALAGILRRDPEATIALGPLWKKVPPCFVTCTMLALGDARDGRGLATLLDQLAAHPELMPVAASQAARIGRSASPEVNREVCTRLREAFAKADSQHGAGLLLALGALDDVDSMPLFVEQLSSEGPAVQAAALWALQHASCTDKGSDAAAWQTWLDAESAWQRSKYPHLVTDLEGAAPTRIMDAVRELRAHKLYRHAVARDMGALLHNGSPSLRALACRMMAEIGSVEALPLLVRALSDEYPEVTTAAHAALVQIVGRDLGPDAQPWAVLAGDREP